MQSDIAREYFERYRLKSIGLTEVSGVVEEAEAVCDIVIDFVDGYRVHFKLPTVQTPASDGVIQISPGGDLSFAAGSAAVDEERVGQFFADIRTRLDKVLHEESVQHITYLGNTFILNNKTVFDVVADEDGRLEIEMHRGDERRPAMLLASALLDGLYDGSIKLQQ
jgi:hypothetical protein